VARHTPPVRGVLGSLLLSLGLLAGSLALSGWWLEHTIFDPSRSGDVAAVALGDDTLRADLARQIADRVSTSLHVDHATVQAAADAALTRPAIANAFASVIRDAHARLIGAATGPVTVRPGLLATAIGDPRAAALPPIRLNVPTVTALDTTRRALDAAVPLLAMAGAALALVGLVIHSHPADALRVLGWWLIGASAVELVVAYVLPVLVVPAVTDNPYAALISEVAGAAIAPLVGVLVMLAGAGIGSLVTAAWMDRERPAQAASAYPAPPYGW
jgi:hypothetical protein